MTDNYEIDIEPGEEMQLDDAGAQNVNRKGRGFGNGSAEAQLGRNASGRLGSAGNPAHATAVRCIIPKSPPAEYLPRLSSPGIIFP
jgi:hypothetical protein